MQSSTSKKRGNKGLREVRLLVTALAVAGTLGLWTWFSRQELVTQAMALKVVEPVQAQPPQEVVLNLAPIPTLVPRLPESSAALAPAPSTSLSSATLPSLSNAVKVILGAPAPRLNRSAPAPVTRTRSS